MSKGNAKLVVLGETGQVISDNASNWAFIYETSLVKDTKWNPGDRVELPDGREYRYAKSLGVLSAAEAAQFDSVGVIAYIAAVITGAVGDTSIIVPATTHAAAFAKDELRGGYVSIFGNNTDDIDHMFRGIIGNDSSAINAAVTLYLDGPLDVVMDTNSAIEVFENPYNHLVKQIDGDGSGGDPDKGKGGVPAVYVSAAATYFWLQTKGPRFVQPASTVVNNMTGVYYRHDGSIEGDIAVGSKDNNAQTSQYAGYRISGDYSGNGPLIMLQG